MTTTRVEVLVWVLIYGGLLIACLGIAVRPGDRFLGRVLELAGGLVTVGGIVLIWVRSRMGAERDGSRPANRTPPPSSSESKP